MNHKEEKLFFKGLDNVYANHYNIKQYICYQEWTRESAL